MARSAPSASDGPDSFNGGLQCLNHHASVRTGITDWCCCCNPCLYNRPISVENPCRCVPKVICFVFRGDDGGRPCCAEYVVRAFAGGSDQRTGYSAQFPGGPSISLSIQSDLATDSVLSQGNDIYGLAAYWLLESTDLYIREIYRIDHTQVTCLAPPSISIDGVTIMTPSGPCVGSITLEPYRSDKITFKKLEWPPSEDIFIPYSPCNCDFAVDSLCVYGLRKNPGKVEGVHFIWDRVLNDRWTYLPPCGDSRVDQETIYLRGDYYGNCWLELDFEQTGSTTNDWADPPNTFDINNPYEIRDGMLPISSCACGLSVRAESTNFRSIVITAGRCQKYDYRYCDKCRCVPESLCVIGSVDGEIFQGKMTWNGEEWVNQGVPAATPFTLSLTQGNCPDPFADRTDPSVCAVQANGTFLVPFLKGPITECGPRLSFDLTSEYTPSQPGIQNWMKGWASICGGCKEANCGPCIAERCGGPPDVIYADLEAVLTTITFYNGDPGNPVTTIEYCNLSVTLAYYQQWEDKVLFCGYRGSAPLPGGGTFFLDWMFSSAELFQMTRVEASGTTTESVSFSFPYSTCEPFARTSEWKSAALQWPFCPWGVYEPTEVADIEYRVLLTE